MALGLATPAGAGAQDLDAYMAGVRAATNGDWATTADAMNRVIEIDPEEKTDVPGPGDIAIDYLPHFWLGLARYRLGDCGAALRSWNESERQGIVTQSQRPPDFGGHGGRYDEVESLLQQCMLEGAYLDRVIRRAGQEIRRAEQAQGRVETMRESPELAPLWQEPEIDEREQRARGMLGSAVASLRAAGNRSDVARARQARNSALQATAMFQALAEYVRARAANPGEDPNRVAATPPPGAAGPPAGDDPNRVEATPLPPSRERLEPQRDPDAGEAGAAAGGETEPDAGAGDETAAGTPDSPDTTTVEKAETTPAAEEPGGEDPDPGTAAAAAPPPALVQAAEAYFAAEYGRVVEILETPGFDDERANAQAFLFRAAAHYARFTLEGGTDEALRDAAAADVRACTDADPDLRPDPRYFSPRFRGFFEETAGGN